MIKYDDLLAVPYKPYGRDMDGMDCYGLVVEMCRRAGHPIQDFVASDNYSPQIDITDLQKCEKILEAVQIERESIQEGDLIEFFSDGDLHIGFILDDKRIIHMTYSGVRITPEIAFKNALFFRVRK